MIYTVITSKSTEDVIKKWKKSNPKLFKKYQKIYHELMDHPRTGIGHPEALVGGNSILYSRHITAHDRIILLSYKEQEIFLCCKSGQGKAINCCNHALYLSSKVCDKKNIKQN